MRLLAITNQSKREDLKTIVDYSLKTLAYYCTVTKKTWLSSANTLEIKEKKFPSLYKIMKNSYLKHCNQLEQT